MTTILVLPSSPQTPNETLDLGAKAVMLEMSCAKVLMQVKLPSRTPTIKSPVRILNFSKGEPGKIFVILRTHVLI